MKQFANHAQSLKARVLDSIFDAEGALATAMEGFCLQQMRQWSKASYTGKQQTELATEIFLTQGKVQGQTPLEQYVELHPSLSEGDRQLILSWQDGFTGLFELLEQNSETIVLKNWMTNKSYTVFADSHPECSRIKQLQPKEILLTRILPLSQDSWIVSGPVIFMGKLGVPKLAVAVNNFKDNHPADIYADAPDLLEKSWTSVESLHTAFLDIFGCDEVTLPGPVLQTKLDALQTQLSDKTLEGTDIDQSQSLDQLMQSSDLEEIQTANAQEKLKQPLDTKQPLRMFIPRIELPPAQKQAPSVTALSHPRWGQVFLDNYEAFMSCLESYTDCLQPADTELLTLYLEKEEYTAFVWQRIAQHHPRQLEAVLREYLQRKTFLVEKDLMPLLESYSKKVEPTLPETASIPLHLHQLIESAVRKVSRPKSKGRSKAQKKTGFA